MTSQRVLALPLVPLTGMFAFGVVLGAALWDKGVIACGTPGLALLQSRWAAVILGLLALAMWPWAYRGAGVPAPISGSASSWDRARVIGLLLAYVALGVGRVLVQPVPPCFRSDHIGAIAAATGPQGRYAVLTGTVVGWPERQGTRARYRVRAETLVWRGRHQPVQGDVWVRADARPGLQYGDRARFVGTLRQPPRYETFDYRRYLARRGIHALLDAREVIPLSAGHGERWRAALYRFRARAAATVAGLFPEPYAALAQGILLGIESNIPRDLEAAFNATGTSHIVVISGFNIAIISGIALALLAPVLGRRRAAPLVMLVILAYVLLVGADAAVVRAGIMGMIYTLGLTFGRQTHVLNSLFASALVMMLVNPHTLWDLGFQLSFLATLGLVVVHPPLAERVQGWLRERLPAGWGERIYPVLDDALLVTLAAQVTTTPLLVGTFGRLSLVSLVANVLILPVQPLVMLGAGASTLVGMVWLPAGQMLAWLPLIPLAWTVAVVRTLARWPAAVVTVSEGWRSGVGAYYGLLAVYGVWHYLRLAGVEISPGTWLSPALRAGARWARAWGPVLGMGLVALWPFHARARVASTAQVTWYPAGHVRLDVPGLPPLVFPVRGPRTDAASEVMRDLPRARGAIWVITHDDPETLAALWGRIRDAPPALVIYPARCVNGWPCPEAWWRFLGALSRRHVPAVPLAPGVPWTFGQDLTLMYTPSDATSPQPVWVRHLAWRLLLPADVPPALQPRLPVPPGGPVVLLAPLPATGAWPDPSALARWQPVRVYVPDTATYPPASRRALEAYPQVRFDPRRPFTVPLRRH